MGPTPFIIISLARSGSNQLVDYINQIPDCMCYGEIFKDTIRNEPGWQRVAAYFSSPAEAQYMHESDLVGFWRQLLSMQPNSTEYLGAKIFYYHRENDPIWDYIYSGSIPIIHLWRNNIFESFVSLVRAEQTGQWSARRREDLDVSQANISFDAQRYCRYRELTIAQYANAQDRLEKCSKVLALEYEQISNTTEISELLSRFFCKDVRVAQTLLKQSQKSPLEYVENRDAAVPYIDDLLSELACERAEHGRSHTTCHNNLAAPGKSA